MSEKDKEYIKWAESLSYIEWPEIDLDRVESAEAKRILHNLICHLYHLEEASIGCI